MSSQGFSEVLTSMFAEYLNRCFESVQIGGAQYLHGSKLFWENSVLPKRLSKFIIYFYAKFVRTLSDLPKHEQNIFNKMHDDSASLNFEQLLLPAVQNYGSPPAPLGCDQSFQVKHRAARSARSAHSTTIHGCGKSNMEYLLIANLQ